jgi:hypothetical protein
MYDFDRETLRALLKDLGVAERINAIGIVLRRSVECCAMDYSGLGCDPVAGSCESSNKFSVCTKCRQFIYQQSN